MKVAAIAALLGMACVLVACGGGGNALAPQFQPQVTNAQDNFQLQTTGISNITQTLTYTWQNSGISADINQACAITGGTAVVTILDANGTAVYSGDLVNNGTFVSATGITGPWTIKVSLSNVSGTLNFRVQKH